MKPLGGSSAGAATTIGAAATIISAAAATATRPVQFRNVPVDVNAFDDHTIVVLVSDGSADFQRTVPELLATMDDEDKADWPDKPVANKMIMLRLQIRAEQQRDSLEQQRDSLVHAAGQFVCCAPVSSNRFVVRRQSHSS
jgi:hypothetical protein